MALSLRSRPLYLNWAELRDKRILVNSQGRYIVKDKGSNQLVALHIADFVTAIDEGGF